MNSAIRYLLTSLMAILFLTITGCEMQTFNVHTGKWEPVNKKKEEQDNPGLVSADGKTEKKDPPAGTDQNTGEKPKPVLVSDDTKPKHQGWDMSVRIDGKSTRPLAQEGDFQIWTVTTCGSTPEVVFTADPGRLGVIDEKEIHLTIYPLHEGRENHKNFFRYAGIAKFKPGTAIKLNLFEHYTIDNKIKMDLKSLPAGKYRFKLRVRGKESWDQQIIELEIR